MHDRGKPIGKMHNCAKAHG